MTCSEIMHETVEALIRYAAEGSVIEELDIQKLCRIQLLELYEELGNILIASANTVIKAHPLADERLTLLLGAVLKLKEATKAIMMLGKAGLGDEMNVLLRTQVETITNICYLQHASDEEFSRFIHHDPIVGYIAMLDIERASKGKLRVPSVLASRVKGHAEAAREASGSDLDRRVWSGETKTLKQRADFVDERMGDLDFGQMLALTYAMGSGYTHGSYKTIHKHGLILTTGNAEHPLSNMFGVNNVIHGIGYVTLIFCRYFSMRFNLPRDRINELAADTVRIIEVAGADYRSWKRRAQVSGS